MLKKILITGVNSYVGQSVEEWIKERHPLWEVETLDMQDEDWSQKDFSGFDTIFHVAGIAHADAGKISPNKEKLYYEVNWKLAVKTAQKAKEAGIKQFIFMSSMIIYGDYTRVGKKRVIDSETPAAPSSCYGDSKWKADQDIRSMESDIFKIAVIRPPMIYGKASKGNYPVLAALARKLIVFPDIKNERSMIHIDNFCEFVRLVIANEDRGIFFPQNPEYVKTSEMVRCIAQVHGKKIRVTRALNIPIWLMSKVPGKIGILAGKAFGNLVYDMSMSSYAGGNYCVCDLAESIRRTEG